MNNGLVSDKSKQEDHARLQDDTNLELKQPDLSNGIIDPIISIGPETKCGNVGSYSQDSDLLDRALVQMSY